MDVTYRKFSSRDCDVIAGLIYKLYKEDPGGKRITPEKIRMTFDKLLSHPEAGTIMVLKSGKEIIGYALLINFWDNEYGGNILVIDEFYITEEYRSKGIATEFINFLAETKFADSVALQLEVTPENRRARKLYEKLGFSNYKNKILMLYI